MKHIIHTWDVRVPSAMIFVPLGAVPVGAVPVDARVVRDARRRVQSVDPFDVHASTR